MNQRIKKLWIEALRSGKYKQGQFRLRTVSNTNEVTYCCLGVLTDLHLFAQNKSWTSINTSQGCLSTSTMKWAELPDQTGQLPKTITYTPENSRKTKQFHNLMKCNDMLNMSFDQIADIIEENL